jgi:hypothetical protein
MNESKSIKNIFEQRSNITMGCRQSRAAPDQPPMSPEEKREKSAEIMQRLRGEGKKQEAARNAEIEKRDLEGKHRWDIIAG